MSILKKKEELSKEIEQLKEVIKERDKLINSLKSEVTREHNLTNEELNRYSRHIFIENIGVKGQEKLKSSRVLIVGCGGLGCPAVQYLAGIGVGCLGLVDYDNVDLSNLHRQILHCEDSVGSSKVQSLTKSIQKLNSNVAVEEHSVQLNSQNANDIISKYDIVIDATDNVATRYLLNDSCVLNKKPLVSGAAVQLEGQLTVYGYKGGPCYRCIFPDPPPPNTVANCGDVGVLPPVPGVIGVLQALQVVHIILGNDGGILSEKMLLFDSTETNFRTIKLRPRSEKCSLCGVAPTISSLIDYEHFCGSPANDKERGVKLLKSEERLSVYELKEGLSDPSSVLLDVRSKIEFEMCHIPSSVNIPLEDLSRNPQFVISLLNKSKPSKVFVICRRGNDSQIAVHKLRESNIDISLFDVIGGLHSWAKCIDTTFPMY